MPDWVPVSVHRYLVHTEQGLPIREVARRAGCHASTVLRQIRKVEVRRDDPMVDHALTQLSKSYFQPAARRYNAKSEPMGKPDTANAIAQDREEQERQTLLILSRLSETGALLAVAEGMDTAVVVRETPGGGTTRTATVSSEFVSVLALNEWVDCARPARISKYRITHAGRSHLGALAAKYEGGAEDGSLPQRASGKRRSRFAVADSPVAALSRRRDRDGTPFLNDTLVAAAERLREDFELAHMGPRVAQDWSAFLSAGVETGASNTEARLESGPPAARARVAEALRYLGPGLGDVALRCCCHLEGLESAEKDMGWSARSGKIVLRIALQRLSVFYSEARNDVLLG